MDRTTSLDHAVTTATVPSTEPRRRWSDGPHYPWSPATDETWSVATHWPALVAVLCEQVADSSGDLGGEIERLCKHGLLSQGEAAAMRRSVEAMRASGQALQQIVRLGAGLYNLSPDRVDLAEVARAAVRERQREVLTRGGELSMDLHRAEVWVDGAVASGLLQAGLDWALGFSSHVRVKVEPGDGGEPARVVFRGALSRSRARTPATGTRRNRRMNDNLHWVLLRQLASCAHLPISRSSTAATESAVVEFPAYITVAPRPLP
ncbi:hypothetical protein [Ramlibacter sp. PS4R-6]|uniref:hypothetical protein n=1 Tax=Ramlibacter sp. PS4R-6 TaxID=3133438 RepID=UPI0030A1B440